jgi:hypothetical protein
MMQKLEGKPQRTVAARFQEAGLYHLDGGIKDREKTGLPVEKWLRAFSASQ